MEQAPNDWEGMLGASTGVLAIAGKYDELLKALKLKAQLEQASNAEWIYEKALLSLEVWKSYCFLDSASSLKPLIYSYLFTFLVKRLNPFSTKIVFKGTEHIQQAKWLKFYCLKLIQRLPVATFWLILDKVSNVN